jgi:uncharacterized protein YjbJ (UPF0337 family)
MTQGELDLLERDVEDARGRLRLDLARLRAPGTMERMKEDVTERVTGSAQDTAHRVLDQIKARAAANPLAALAIGAGLAWRFAHRPPIASLLVGAGLLALMKTNPQERHVGADFVERAGEFAGTVKETVSEKLETVSEKIDELSHSELAAKAGELSGTVKQKAGELSGAVAAKAGELGGTVRETVGQWSARTGEFANEAAAEVSTVASSWAKDGSRLAQQGSKMAMEGSKRVAAAVDEDRDTYLLGAAAIAIAAAIGISYQRSAN